MNARILPIVLLVLILSSTAALAHGAADPRDYETRLLHDCNDDWGGHTAVNDGHDLIALELQEAYNATLGDNVVLFRFLMNGGYNSDSTRPELKEVLSFTAAGATVTKELRTSDNVAFTGTFDAFTTPAPVADEHGDPDGSRFSVGAMVKFSSLGLKIGDKLGGFNVQGHAGAAKADQMPGGFTTAGQTFADCSTVAPEQSEPTSYPPAGQPPRDYVLKGTGHYATLTLGASKLTTSPGGNETVQFALTNSLKEAQAYALKAAAPTGVAVVFHTDRYSEGQTEGVVDADAETIGHFYVVSSQAAASGPIAVTLTTDLGGRVEHNLPLTVQSSTTSSSIASGPAGPASPDGKAPGASFVALVACLAVALVMRRHW